MSQKMQILHCIRNTMKQAISSEEPSQRKALLEAADILVNELMLLEDHNFYITRYNKGRQLLMQGLNYISGDSTDIFHDADYIPASVSEEMSRIKISRATTQLTTLLKNIVTLLPTTGNEDILTRHSNRYQAAYRMNSASKYFATRPGSFCSLRRWFSAFDFSCFLLRAG